MCFNMYRPSLPTSAASLMEGYTFRLSEMHSICILDNTEEIYCSSENVYNYNRIPSTLSLNIEVVQVL